MVSYDTRWIFHLFSASLILVLRSLWGRFAFSVCNMLMSLKLVPDVIYSITLLNVSATSGIVITRIGSNADVHAGCPCGGVDWISERWWGTEFCVRNGYHSCSSPMIFRKSFCAIFTHSSMVFPNTIDRGNPITVGGSHLAAILVLVDSNWMNVTEYSRSSHLLCITPCQDVTRKPVQWSLAG